MRNSSFILYTLLQLHLPVFKNTAFFRSFNGQYNDNPKYISEALHEKYPDLKIVWAIRDGKRESFPDYVKVVELYSKEYAKYIARSQIVIDNYSGCRTNFAVTNNPIKRMLFRALSRRKKGQFNLSTWHGTALKHIALDEPKYKNAKFCKGYFNTDLLIAGCDLTASEFRTAFAWEKEILKCGTPRNDILFKDCGKGLKEKLGLPVDKKVVLFAPTFRDNVEMSGLRQLKEMDIEKLLLALKEKFGGEWCFVFRSHNLVMSAIQKESVQLNADIINGNACEDMAEYLSCTDLLITDYSSSMFDYMLTKKPCFVYAPDLFTYKNAERGFYFEIEETPFDIAQTADGLIENIGNFRPEVYTRKAEEFLTRIGNAEKGRAADRIVEEIEKRVALSK